MKNTLLAIWNFYLEGFRSMTLGRTLWLIILVKLSLCSSSSKFSSFPTFSAIILQMPTRVRMWEMS